MSDRRSQASRRGLGNPKSPGGGDLLQFAVDVDPFRSLAVAHAPRCPFRAEHRDSVSVYWFEFHMRQELEDVLEEEARQGFAVRWCDCVECRRVAGGGSTGGSDRGGYIPPGMVESTGDEDRSWWPRKNAECELQVALRQLAEDAFRLAALAGRVHPQVFAELRRQCKLERASVAALKRQIKAGRGSPDGWAGGPRQSRLGIS